MNDVVLRDTVPARHTVDHASARLPEPIDSFANDDVASRSIRTDERGQGLAEYGLILGLIAIACIAAVLFFSGNLQGMLSNVGSNI